MDSENNVLDHLKDLGISYQIHRHPAVFTVEEANAHWGNLNGMHCKNLFLRNKKGKQHYLVVIESNKTIDIKALNEQLNERLSFASPERLKKYLNLEAGSVSPFGLINDLDKAVILILDEDINRKSQINFHPNINTSTLTIDVVDFMKFLTIGKHPYRFISF